MKKYICKTNMRFKIIRTVSQSLPITNLIFYSIPFLIIIFKTLLNYYFIKAEILTHQDWQLQCYNLLFAKITIPFPHVQRLSYVNDNLTTKIRLQNVFYFRTAMMIGWTIIYFIELPHLFYFHLRFLCRKNLRVLCRINLAKPYSWKLFEFELQWEHLNFPIYFS